MVMLMLTHESCGDSCVASCIPEINAVKRCVADTAVHDSMLLVNNRVFERAMCFHAGAENLRSFTSYVLADDPAGSAAVAEVSARPHKLRAEPTPTRLGFDRQTR